MAKTLFHCVAGLRGASYLRVLQNNSVRPGERLADLDAPVDVKLVAAHVDAALMLAARNVLYASEAHRRDVWAPRNVTLDPRYPRSRLSPAMSAHCSEAERDGWVRRVEC